MTSDVEETMEDEIDGTTNRLMEVAVGDPKETASSPASTKANEFSARKSAAHAMMDAALLMANISQLRMLVADDSATARFFTPLLCLILFSIVCQILFALVILVIWVRETRQHQNPSPDPSVNHRHQRHHPHDHHHHDHPSPTPASHHHHHHHHNDCNGHPSPSSPTSIHEVGSAGVSPPDCVLFSGFNASREIDGARRQIDGASRQMDDARRQIDGAPKQIDGAPKRTTEDAPQAPSPGCDCNVTAMQRDVITQRLHALTLLLVFLITVANMFITGLGFDPSHAHLHPRAHGSPAGEGLPVTGNAGERAVDVVGGVVS